MYLPEIFLYNNYYKFSIFLILIILISSCSNVNLKYIGQKLTPTEHVKILFSDKDIKEKYKVIGKAIVTSYNEINTEKVQNDIINKAEQVGANAVVIRNYNIVPGREHYLSSSSYNEYSPYSQTSNYNGWGDQMFDEGMTPDKILEYNYILNVQFIRYK
ncbi:MAG TPA: hypothetical protein QF753_18630 [Victivallales bacterium]|nr:hypothetical protein [Victivallales bacterium]